ncbi:ATP-binding protein [Chelatococcus reniformis]|uniref:histidine kinase n=1 Tax=Chelatococcus reniformis TaxID=1494448 RepID=A0A916XIT8_9HYPH|nr:ATP-binding protein [Chelatococcus reniformis]GGC76472.1 hypothetical protein GCM10010994_38490 [Chelatococcus reniformis]
MQIKATIAGLLSGSIESSPIEDAVVLVEAAGLAIGGQPGFSARVRRARDAVVAARWVEIPIVGSNGEVSGILCHDRRGSSAGVPIPVAGRVKVSMPTDATPSVAHDISSLFTLIGTGLRQLECESNAEDRRAIVGRMEEAISRGSSLSGQLLDAAQPRRTSSNGCVSGSHLEAIAGKLELWLRADIRVRTEVAPGLWAVNADVEELSFALSNLCRNSADAMPDGGVITVAARNVEQSSAAMRRFVEIVVIDDGEGMSEEVLSQALIPHFTTRPRGNRSGLGLTEVQRFADARDGAIRIESKPGIGTLVRLFLPRAEAAGRSLFAGEITYSPSPEGGAFHLINSVTTAPTS